MTEERIAHEYLEAENYYENRPVQSSRTAKWCNHCGGTIPKGSSHDVHHFYPEFSAYPTHKKCTEDFIKSLRTPEDDNEGED